MSERIDANRSHEKVCSASENPELLRHAVTHGNWLQCWDLLEEGANPNAKNSIGFTPLHCAATHDHVNCALVLIAFGADVGNRDDDGCTPLDVAINARNALVEDALRWPLHFAAHDGHTALCRKLLELGHHPMQKDGMGFDPVTYAQNNDEHETAAVLMAWLSRHVAISAIIDCEARPNPNQPKPQ